MAQLLITIPVNEITGKILETDITFAEQEMKGNALFKGGASDINTFLSAAWDRIEETVKKAAMAGWEASKELVNNAVDFINETAKLLGDQAQLFKDRLIQKLQDSLAKAYDLISGSLKQEIKIGTHTLALTGLDVEYKLVFTGSVELSLVALCKMVASGELTIKGTYGKV